MQKIGGIMWYKLDYPTNLIEIDGPHARYFHPIAQVYKIFIRAFFLLCY